MTAHWLIILQLRKNAPCQLLPKLNTPLIIAENVPDNALNEYFMFVNRDKRT